MAKLRAHNVGKQFAGNWVLKNASLDLNPGEVHALLGENGAGKSTFIKIATGVLQPDEGVLNLDGKELSLRSPKDALREGISVVHQELDLFDNLSVAENIYLGHEYAGFSKPSPLELDQLARDSFKGLDDGSIDPKRLLGELNTSQKQIVALARAFSWSAQVVVFDEPTSALNDREVDALLDLIGELKRKGLTILYVSHKLNEVFRVADRASVLRDGFLVGTFEVAETTSQDLLSHMLGRPPKEMFPERPADLEGGVQPRLLIKELTAGHLKGVDLSVSRGEIVALAGLPDSGANNLLRAAFGLLPIRAGSIELDGSPFRRPKPVAAIKKGIAFLPADRLQEGIFPLMSVKENLTAVSVANRRNVSSVALEDADKLSIRYNSLRQTMSSLSGGNQQKSLLARWLPMDPKVLLLDDPTRGIDVGAKADIYGILRNIADSGTSIVFTSSELLEVSQLADRIYVFRQGHVVEILPGGTDEETLEKRIQAK